MRNKGRAEKRSVSAPVELFAEADKRCEALRYSTFSDYIQALLFADVHGMPAHKREPIPAKYPDKLETVIFGAAADKPSSDPAELAAREAARKIVHYTKQKQKLQRPKDKENGQNESSPPNSNH